jgi:DNA-binding transcriptional LysR family regulator
MENYISIESLSLFVKVVEAGSFAQVCHNTKTPKATLSRKISQLEEYLGAQLFVRNTRNLKLTEIGREILTRANVILAAHDDSKTLVSKTKAEPQGLLRISAGVEFGQSIIAPLVNKYVEKFPKVQIELDLTGRRVDLIYENFDLGIRIGPLEDSSLSARKIGSFTYGIFATPQFVKKFRIGKNINVISGLPALGFTRVDKHLNWKLINDLDEREIKISPRIISNNYWVLLDAAKAGVGLVYMPKFLAQKAIDSKELVQVFPEWHSVEIPIHFIYPSQKFLSSKVRTFIDFSLVHFKTRSL